MRRGREGDGREKEGGKGKEDREGRKGMAGPIPNLLLRVCSLSVLTAIFFQVNLAQMVILELRMMEVVVTTGAIRCAKLQSNHHHQQTNTQLFTAWMPFLSPNQQCQSTVKQESNCSHLSVEIYLLYTSRMSSDPCT